jgi:hypothetical protein
MPFSELNNFCLILYHNISVFLSDEKIIVRLSFFSLLVKV